MPQSFTSLQYHSVFSTKERRPFITADIQQQLFDYLGGILKNHQGVLLAAGGMPDHIHLLAVISKQQSISEALRLIKSNSSGWVHETFPKLRTFAWQEGYAAFSVSYSGMDRVKEYIATQAEHHRKVDFKSEFVSLLRRHEIAYDERYLWD